MRTETRECSYCGCYIPDTWKICPACNSQIGRPSSPNPMDNIAAPYMPTIVESVRYPIRKRELKRLMGGDGFTYLLNDDGTVERFPSSQ